MQVFGPPRCAKRVYHAKPKLSIEDLWEDDNLPSIDLTHTKDYSNVNRIDGQELAQMEIMIVKGFETCAVQKCQLTCACNQHYIPPELYTPPQSPGGILELLEDSHYSGGILPFLEDSWRIPTIPGGIPYSDVIQ